MVKALMGLFLGTTTNREPLVNEEITKPTGQMIAALFQHETSQSVHGTIIVNSTRSYRQRKGPVASSNGAFIFSYSGSSDDFFRGVQGIIEIRTIRR
jgi:hypothetical protein